MTPREHEWQHEGDADGDHNDPNRDVLMTPRPWPKMNGAQVMLILFACGVLARVAWWLVTK